MTEHIQVLVSQGRTKEALAAAADWLRGQSGTALNDVIVLRSRYEQVERDAALNLISSEETSRALSQINFSLLTILQQYNNASASPVMPLQARTNRWLWAGLGLVGIIAISVWALRGTFAGNASPVERPEVSTPAHHSPEPRVSNTPTDTAATTQSTESSPLQLPGKKEVTLRDAGRQVTFTVLDGRVEVTGDGAQKMVVNVRCYVHPGSGADMFWNQNLRLMVEGLPYAPVDEWSDVVAEDTFVDREVSFVIKDAVRSAQLKITLREPLALLPVEW